jgi:hypothetical protein
MTETTLNAAGDVDLLLCSPDGESRGLLARTGDLFPLDPSYDLFPDSEVSPSAARPWGLRFLQVQQPQAGAHEGTAQATTAPPGGDRNSPEDMTND